MTVSSIRVKSLSVGGGHHLRYSGSKLMQTALKRWTFLPQDVRLQRRLSEALGVSLVTAQILINRGIKDLDAARLFLQPRLEGLHDPELLPDIEPAVRRLMQAARERERVLIYGDYDVDGMASIALLKELLELVGLEPTCYIPNRLQEGYGLHTHVLRKLGDRASLVVAVDCGARAVEQARECKRLGLDLIIVDHHEPGAELPEACAVVNPKRADSSYPFPDLAAVGVTYKLAWALAQKLWGGAQGPAGFQDFLVNGLALVALGTVADVVPLVGENRILAGFGLGALETCELAGIRSLIRACGLTQQSLTAQHIAYRLGPRLNAAGRLGEAELSLKLLCSRSPEEADELVTMLETRNRQRQQIQRQVYAQAEKMIAAELDIDEVPAIVLAHPDWPIGVVGIVASQLAERYYRPVVLLAAREEGCRGSGRSVGALHLLEVLEECAELLSSFGGHARAAGMSLPLENLDSFRTRFCQGVADRLEAEDRLPEITLDLEVPLWSVSPELVRELARLGPFGEGNPLPVLASQDVRVAGMPKRMGAGGKHLSFYAAQGGASVRAVGFGMGEWAERLTAGGNNVAIAYTLQFSHYGGGESVELHLVDIRSEPVGSADAPR